MIDGSKRGLMQVKDVRNFLDSVLDEDIHTKRIASLANATLGVMTGTSLGVAVIGKSLAQARGLLPKHAVKQVDRLLSNPRIEAWDVFASWVPEMVGFADTKLFGFLDDLGFELCHPPERQHQGQCGRWADPFGGRVGRPRRSGTQTA